MTGRGLITRWRRVYHKFTIIHLSYDTKYGKVLSNEEINELYFNFMFTMII